MFNKKSNSKAIQKAVDSGAKNFLVIGERDGKIICFNDEVPIERLLYYMRFADKQLFDLAYQLDSD